MERTGWSLTNHVAECVLERWLVSDHPVCGWLSVASRLFIEAAATPPQEEGNARTPHSLVIHSPFSCPGLWSSAAAHSGFLEEWNSVHEIGKSEDKSVSLKGASCGC